MWLDEIFIGYGYRPYRAIGWVGFFVLVGALMLAFDGQYKKIAVIDQNRNRWGVALDCLGFSFDMLLPIIRLRERHYGIDLDGPARYYFYAQKIMGTCSRDSWPQARRRWSNSSNRADESDCAS